MMNTKSNLYRKIILAGFTLFLLAVEVCGQTALNSDSLNTEIRPFEIPNALFDPDFWILFLLAAIMLFVIISLAYSVRSLSVILSPQEVVQHAPHAEKVTAWKKLMKALTRSVPVHQEEDVMLNHNYDGIRELDNKLPPWWVYGFYATIFFAFIYLLNYHIVKTGKLQMAEYNDEMTLAEQQKTERERIAGNTITSENVVALADAASLSAGKEMYLKNCLACHGNLGQGGVGPNLTDAYWIHGGGIKNIFQIITNGVPQKGMISWKTQLSARQMEEVASFILTLQGTNPPGAKEAQGDLYNETPADSSIKAMTLVRNDSSGSKKMDP